MAFLGRGFMPLRSVLALMCGPVVLSACTVGPDYHRPEARVAAPYAEDKGWTPAMPQAPGDWTNWWSIYNDPVLDDLEKQVDISNQNLKASEAAYRVARAQVGVDRGALLPDISASGSARASGGGSGSSSSSGSGSSGSGRGASSTLYALGAQANWDLDVWGRIRRTVEAGVANAKASAADLASARLSAQSLLASDYFLLRAADEQKRLLDATIDSFKASLLIAQNRFKAGITTQADIYAAQTQIDNTQAQTINNQLTRAKLVHAIAALVGKQPSEVEIAVTPMPDKIPVIPAGIPSTLLQRRPDIASSEEKVVAANAQIGVAIAAYYPDLTLSASYGPSANTLGSLFNASNAVWSVGPSLAETIFNGGAREAQTVEARANYDEAVANYRQTVLDAFQSVEDDLASLRILEQQAGIEDTTVADARRSEQLTLNQYKAGVADYTAVITAQTTRLNAEITSLNVLSQRLTSSVDLVKQLGGGWDASKLPQPGFFYSLPEVTQDEGPNPSPP